MRKKGRNMNKINNEKEQSKKYLLYTFSFDNYTLVEISLKNVAKIEAMIINDSSYIKSVDKKAGPSYNYIGSTAYWMTELKNYYDGNSTEQFEKIIKNAVIAVNNENSTHLNADGVGIEQITNRLIPKENSLKELLKNDNKEYELFKLISNKTEVNDKNHKARKNPSFASKFCHYASFYLFEGTEYQDNYSIYDTVLKKALPLYLSYYNLEMPNLNKYDEYQKAVDDIIRVSNSNVSRNGFDHLLWYYHKGRI